MSDFFQNGPVATLHRLGRTDLARLEPELAGFSAASPIALALPCHADELGTPALQGIVRELKEVPYLSEIVVGIDGADADAWHFAKNLFCTLPQKPLLVWNNGPRIADLIRQLEAADLAAQPGGKGRNLWMCIGTILALGRCQMVMAHDCDIHTYSRELPARLCYPVAHPQLGFDFCKGFSARFSDRLNGRVMRLLFTPLIRSLQSLIGPVGLLTFLDSFRYPLSGEVSLGIDLVRQLRMPGDWSVEVGMLAEIYRLGENATPCQIDVAESYDHKHRELSPEDPRKGLNKMAHDIVKRVLRTLAEQGVKLDGEILDALPAAYIRQAGEAMRFSAADAVVNGLNYDREQEELSVATFAGSIRAAAVDFLADPNGDPMIPDWNTVEAALPDILPALLDAVRSDNGN